MTPEDTRLIRARELRAMIEDPTPDDAAMPGLMRDFFRLLRRPRRRGVSSYATEGR